MLFRSKAMGEFNQNDADKIGARLIVADFGAESCGDAVRLFWLVDEIGRASCRERV